MPAYRPPALDPPATDSSFLGQLRTGSRERDNSLGYHPVSSPLKAEPCLPGVTYVWKSKRLPAPIKLVVCRQIGSRPERKLAGEQLRACTRFPRDLHEHEKCSLASWLLRPLGFSLPSLWCLFWAEVPGGPREGIAPGHPMF